MKKQKVKLGLKFQNILQSIFRGSGFKHLKFTAFI